jgi:hypothetical protein
MNLEMMMEDKEIWVDIKNSNYKVSQFGNIKSCNQDKMNGKIVKGFLRNNQCYIALRLIINNEYKFFRLHRIVAEHFISNPNNFNIVDHIDRNRQNNRIDNLRWVSPSHNTQNSTIQHNNTSGIKGVSYTTHSRLHWCARWVEDGTCKSKYFMTKEEAIQYRKEMVNLHYSKDHYNDQDNSNRNQDKKYKINNHEQYENEQWRTVDESNGDYEISSYGRVKSYKNNKDGILLSGTYREESHQFMVKLTINNKERRFSINRLVAQHFIPNPENLEVVDHIDGNRLNNQMTNLRWVTMSQNRQNSKIPKHNKTGIKGVQCMKDGRKKKWLVSWYEDKKRKSTYFYTEEEAVEYRKQMVNLYYSREHYIEDR